MPELPEVEVSRRGLIPHLLNRKISRINVGSKNLRLPIPRQQLAQFIQDQTITAINRRGKYLVFSCHNQAVILVHLGMTGRLGIFPGQSPPAVHDHLVFHLDNGMEMRYNDSRRFGCIQVMSPSQCREHDPFAHLGPEPLPTEKGPFPSMVDPHLLFTVEYLCQKAGKKLTPIKNLLMDGGLVVGIGNIYANEILFATGILPTTAAGSLGRDKWTAISRASRQILSQAIKEGGSTIRDYISSSGKPGYFQLKLKVYGRAGEPCCRCRTLITKTLISGRATFFCPTCQQ